MDYNIKVLILFIFLIFVFLYPLNTRALPLCECFEDVDCGPGYYCDDSVTCTSYEESVFGGMCKSCECYNYGSGWHDAPFWGGCNDCNLNSQNWCGPCGEAKAFCDGCLWNDTWNPFRDETYPGSYGHKCPGNPPICASGQTECRTGEQVYECDSDRCGWYLKEDCDDRDGCVGTTYRDYSCSGGGCTSVDFPCDSRCNNFPDIPTLIAPPHNVWIDYDPTFKAEVYDPDGDMVRAHFKVIKNDTGVSVNGVGSWVEGSGISEWGPVNLGNYAQYDWKAYPEDVCGFEGGWKGYWRVKIDKCPCSSSEGLCCSNNCNFDDTSIVCQTEAETEYQCSGTSCGDDYQKRTRDRYCSGDAAACIGSYSAPSGWITVQDCNSDSQRCSLADGGCIADPSCAPTLSTTIFAAPDSGIAPLSGVVLTAAPSGTAIGTINYTFYCNRSDSGINITAGYAHKIDNTNSAPYSAPAGICDSVYANAGAYTAKVIIERGGLASEARATVTVSCLCSSSEGLCCSNNCNFDSSAKDCGSGYDYQCSGIGCGEDALRQSWTKYCSGSSAGCDGEIVKGAWETFSEGECAVDELCYTTSPYCRQAAICSAPPSRSNGQPTGTLPSGTTSTTISLDVYEINATCKYDTSPDTPYASMPNTFPTVVEPLGGPDSHRATVTGLSDGNTYNYYVRCQGETGHANLDDFLITFSVAIAAPTVALKANDSDGPVAIDYNTSAVLTWTSTNTESCADCCTASGDWSDSKAASGSESTGNLASSKTYILTCTSPGGSASDSVAVNVSSATLSTTLAANPSSGIAPLSGVVLTAAPSGTAIGTINYTFYCNRSDSGINITAGYAHKIDNTNSAPYSAPAGICDSVYANAGAYTAKVIIERGGLASEARAAVIVSIPPPTVALKANDSDGPVAIDYNTSAVLTWTSTNTDTCTASGDWSGSKVASGSESTGNLTSNKIYTLTCTNTIGESASDSVTVNVAPIVTLTARPSSILKGQSSTLEWSAVNANSCSALWTTSTATSGSATVSPTEDTTYTITCIGPGGSGSASTSVSIVALKGFVPCGRDFDENGKLDEYEECQLCHFFLLARNILTFGLETIAPLCVLLIIIGGILILVSGGYTNLLTIGKKLIYAAVIGIIIAFGAWLIINSIMVLLTNPDVFPWPWNQIKCP